MSFANETDFALIKVGDGAEPEVFTAICGIQDVTINKTANTSDRFVRDCAKPGEIPYRKTRSNGKQMDISGSGLSNVDNIEDLEANLGVIKNYIIELYKQDGTDAGLLLGTYSGAFRMISDNLTSSLTGDSSADISMVSEGAWAFVATGS
jgi:hypothetical protein